MRERFKAGKYEIYLSTVTLEEAADCPEPKRSGMYDYFEQINYTPIEITDDTSDFAFEVIVSSKPLSQMNDYID